MVFIERLGCNYDVDERRKRLFGKKLFSFAGINEHLVEGAYRRVRGFRRLPKEAP